uniref:Uncharacterized protein n=1 Tax=Timema genevievae TaxID=629358 RepID=A0A7R9PJP4_TIMGE|nr:unnamed protein product [Timema genevievae]
MATKYLLINYGCDWKTIEAVGKCLPELDVVPALACTKHVYSSYQQCHIALRLAACYAFLGEHGVELKEGTPKSDKVGQELKEVAAKSNKVGQELKVGAPKSDKVGQELKEVAAKSDNAVFVCKLTLIIETIYPVDRSTFVVPSQQKEVLRILNLGRPLETASECECSRIIVVYQRLLQVNSLEDAQDVFRQRVTSIDLYTITGWTSVAEIFELSSAYHWPELPDRETRGGGLIRFPGRYVLPTAECVVIRGAPSPFPPLTSTQMEMYPSFENVMVLLESVVSGHKYIQIRERLAEKMEVIMFDPYRRNAYQAAVETFPCRYLLTHLKSQLSVLHLWAVFLQMFHRANHVAGLGQLHEPLEDVLLLRKVPLHCTPFLLAMALHHLGPLERLNRHQLPHSGIHGQFHLAINMTQHWYQHHLAINRHNIGTSTILLLTDTT